MTVIDEMREHVLSLTEAELDVFLRRLPPDELELVDQVLADAAGAAEPWRSDPLAMEQHLAGKLKAWRYAQLLSHAFTRLIDGSSPRQIWMLPARYGKTLIGSRWGPVWALDRIPWLQIILTSYGDQLASENAGAVRDTINAYAADLNVRVRNDRSARDDWYTTEGGHVMAAGVDGSMTGYGGDLIVIDDPFKNWQEAASEARRDHVWDWYRSVVSLRKQQETSAELIVGTRWHADDLQGRLLDPPDGEEPEDWEVIRLPALAEASNPDAAKWWERGPDPLGREEGEPLEPRRFSKIAVKTRARILGSFLANALEQQRPSASEGTILKRGWWQFYEALPVTDRADWLISWDAAFKDKDDSDFCVGQVWMRVGANKYLVDQVRDRMSYPAFRTAVQTLAAKWPEARTILVEDKANGTAVMADLKKKVSGMVPSEPMGSKESRAHAASGDVEAGNVFLPDPSYDLNLDPRRVDRSFVHDFIEECANFPNDTNDDQVDTFTQAILRYTNADAPVDVPAPGGAKQRSDFHGR